MLLVPKDMVRIEKKPLPAQSVTWARLYQGRKKNVEILLGTLL